MRRRRRAPREVATWCAPATTARLVADVYKSATVAVQKKTAETLFERAAAIHVTSARGEKRLVTFYSTFLALRLHMTFLKAPRLEDGAKTP